MKYGTRNKYEAKWPRTMIKYDMINKSNKAVLTAQEGRFEMSCTLDTYVCIHI